MPAPLAAAVFGSSIPRWKSLLHLDYDFGSLGMFARWQHIDGARDASYPDFAVPAYDYVDLGASYVIDAGMLQGLTARVGVDNVFDKEPPIFTTWQQANTDPSLYDVLGRRYSSGCSIGSDRLATQLPHRVPRTGIHGRTSRFRQRRSGNYQPASRPRAWR